MTTPLTTTPLPSNTSSHGGYVVVPINHPRPTSGHVEPSKGAGCVRGCLRDKHVLVTVLSASFLALIVLLLLCALRINCVAPFFIPVDNAGLWVVFSIVGLAFFIEALFSDTLGYLRHINQEESLLMVLQRLRETPPTIYWHIQCYHVETHTEMQTVWTEDDDGNQESHQEEVEVTERVNTHAASGSLKYREWADKSRVVHPAEANAFRMTKVDFSKTLVKGDQGCERAKNAFISSNNLDTQHDFTETFDITGYTSKMLTLVDLNDMPTLLSPKWYLLSQLTVVFALPYRYVLVSCAFFQCTLFASWCQLPIYWYSDVFFFF
jgi:hypothetical protein